MRKILIVLTFLFSLTQLIAQDRLFSQFYASPLTMNPALTGAFEGKFRVSSIYRDQWRDAMDKPFTTFSSALDLRWRMGKSASKVQDHASVGVMFFTDKAGPLQFGTTQISISAAYHKALDARNTQILSLGFQGGVAQRNLNFGNITFEDQFNGTTGYSDPTAERFPENNFAYGDYAVGLNYVFAPKSSRIRVFAGGAMHHFLRPTMSHYRRTDDESPLPDNKLDIRYAGHVSAQLPLSAKIMVLPRAIFDMQGQHKKLDAGANFRFNTSEYKNIALHVGAYVRPVTDYGNNIRVDALVGLVGIEFNNVLLGTSYDYYMGATSAFSRGTFEISVAYLGEYEDDLILCPKF
jgi:type IX secretion system PorP/SprF family membrane protein